MTKPKDIKEHLCKHRVRRPTLRPLSLVIITLNEENNLARCIKSVPFAAEIVVLDSGSTDGTKELALSLGAKFIQEPWRGYAAQKARAIELSSEPWVLSLDADEALSEELAAEIQTFLAGAEADSLDGLRMARKSFYLGRWIHHGGWYPDWQLRLFHKDRASWVGGHVHERVAAARVKNLKGDLYHYPFENLEDQVSTNNHYSTLGARDLKARGKRYSFLRLCVKPLTKFVELYVFKKGFLDGVAGFVIAAGGAYSVFLKWAKLWELERNFPKAPSAPSKDT